MSETRLVETADPEEVFAALSDGTRVDILRALWDDDDHTATFSELREAVGITDSGQFNYHLDKLVGRFVTKTDAGYELTLAGMQINGAIHAGSYTMEGALDAVALEDPCPYCGGARTFHYEDEHVSIECAGCEFTASAPVPPGVFASYADEEAPAVASRYFRTILDQVGNGFCWNCDGRVEPTVRPLAPPEGADDSAVDPEIAGSLPFVDYDCKRCGASISSDLGTALASHPAVVGFYYDHGVDVRERPFHEFSALDTDQALIRSHDPLSASVTYEHGGDTLTLVVDANCTVVETGDGRRD